METIQLNYPLTIDGIPYSTAKVIVISPQHSKTVQPILPKAQASSAQNVSGVCENSSRRIHFSKKALNHPRPQSVTKRNTRERNRIRAVNQGFVTLANHVPEELRGKKISKVDTLKAAIDYINELQKLLDGDDTSATSTSTEDIMSSPCSSSSSSGGSPCSSSSGGYDKCPTPSSISSFASSPCHQPLSAECQAGSPNYPLPPYPTLTQPPYLTSYAPQPDYPVYQPNNTFYQQNFPETALEVQLLQVQHMNEQDMRYEAQPGTWHQKYSSNYHLQEPDYQCHPYTPAPYYNTMSSQLSDDCLSPHGSYISEQSSLLDEENRLLDMVSSFF